jgi:hypothetical protein
MIVALVLQLAALAGFPVGGYLAANWGGLIVGSSISALYVGVALDRAGER